MPADFSYAYGILALVSDPIGTLESQSGGGGRVALGSIIPIVSGDTEVLQLTVRDAVANAALDITGATLWFTAKFRESDADTAAVFKKTNGSGIVLTNPTVGIATITVAATDTDKINVKTRLAADVRLKDSTGKVFTIMRGFVDILPAITQVTT